MFFETLEHREQNPERELFPNGLRGGLVRIGRWTNPQKRVNAGEAMDTARGDCPQGSMAARL
jgi:hypothetical protein